MSITVDAIALTPAATMTAAGVFQTTAGGNLILSAPGSNRLNGKNFTVVASGRVSTSSGTYTATISPVLYGDASLATVTTKPLFTAGAGTIAFTGTVAAGVPWSLWAEFQGDNVSATLGGIAQASVANKLSSQTAVVAPVSAINFSTEPPVKFAVGFNLATGTLGASPKFVIQEFYIFQE